MNIDTENVLDELGSRVGRLQKLEWSIESRSKRQIKELSDARDNCAWIRKVIQYAEARKHLDWLEGTIEELQTEDYQVEELRGVPKHIIEHAISLAKQAIATNAPSLV